MEVFVGVRDGKWPGMETGTGWKMKPEHAGDGRTLKMELLPNILLTLVMLAIGELEQLQWNNKKLGIQEYQKYNMELLGLC